MEEPTLPRRTKQTARKSTGSEPPKKPASAAARKRTAGKASADQPPEASGIADGPPKKRRSVQKRVTVLTVDSAGGVQPVAGPSQQVWSGFGGAAAPRRAFATIPFCTASLMIGAAASGAPGLYPGLISLKQLCDLAQTSQGVVQSNLQTIDGRIQELQAEYEANRTDTAELRAEVERLRETNRQLYSENVSLRQQLWGAGRAPQ